LVAVSGDSTIRASTNRFVAEFELPWVPSVVRLICTEAGFAPESPSTNVISAVAFAVKVPAVELLMVRVHVAVLFELLSTGVAHVLVDVPGTGDTLGVIESNVTVVPAGIALATIVKMWLWPTSFTAEGVIEMLPSTQRFVTGPELGATPSVLALLVTPPPNETVDEAFTTVVPAALDEIHTEH